jgi:hypothetical protein
MPRSLPCGCARARRRRPLLHIFTFAYLQIERNRYAVGLAI